ncbi:MAG: hypothetical protein KGZ50_05940 [Peptococcaceae bacterium]|nr:hypothetical protein [Peptococcaceae bacterium]
MSTKMARLAEIAAQYSLTASPLPVDNELCLATRDGLAAVHDYTGSTEEITWAGSCLEQLKKRGIKGLSLFIRTVGDSFAAEVNQSKFFLTEYFPGTACDSSNIFEVRAIARLLGQVHAASEELLYLLACPPTRVAPAWREVARERAAYWRLAGHRYRQGDRGEAVRQLLRCAEESLNRVEELVRYYDGARVLTFPHPTFDKFVYMSVGHQVCLNQAYDCLVDWSYISVGHMLVDGGYPNDRVLHFLAAYTNAHPLNATEWQLLFAYLLYPHEWVESLDELARGRPNLKGREVLSQLQDKAEWLDWLQEQVQKLPGVEVNSSTISEVPPPQPEIALPAAPTEKPQPTRLEKIVWPLFPKISIGKGKGSRNRP